MMRAKSLFSLTIAMLALAACSENEITEQNPAVNKAIGFDTYTSVQTRGTEGNLVTLQGDNFGVMAYQTTGAYSTTGAKSEFMKNQPVSWNTGTNKWEYNPVKYWPAGTDEKVSFFAYSPYDSDGTVYNAATISADASNNPKIGFTLLNYQASMIDLLVSDPAASGCVTTDLTSASGTVKFKFIHPLTRVVMEAKTDTDISANTDTKVFVTGVSLIHTSKLNSKGTFDMKEQTWANNTTDYLASPYVLTEYDGGLDCGVLNLTAANFAGYTAKSIDISAGGTTATSLFATLAGGQSSDEYLFLLPVNNTTGTAAAGDVKVKIAYDIVNKINDTTHSKSSVEKEVNLPAGVLKKGAAHKFTFIIGLNAITFDVDTDANWGTETNNDVTVQ